MLVSKLIEGRNIILRPHTQKDFKLIHQWMTNPQVTGEHIDISLSDLRKGYEERIKGDYYLLFMIDRENTTIGFCNVYYHRKDPESKIVDVGIFIGEIGYWGKELGKDALTTLLIYTFDILDIEEVTVTYNKDNERIKRLTTKLGFKVEQSDNIKGKTTKEEIEGAKITKEEFRQTVSHTEDGKLFYIIS